MHCSTAGLYDACPRSLLAVCTGYVPLRAPTCVPLLSLAVAQAALDAASALRAGDAAFSRSEYIAAVRHFSEAIDVDATSAMLLHKRAAAHISLGDHAAGSRDLSAALELEPESIQVLMQRSAPHPTGDRSLS